EPRQVESPAKPAESAKLSPSEQAPASRKSVGSPALESPVAKDAAATDAFALIRVLVLNKVTRAPMEDIDLSATYDTGSPGHRIHSRSRSRGKPFETLHTDSNGRVEIEMPANVTSSVWAYGRKHDAGSDHADIG